MELPIGDYSKNPAQPSKSRGCDIALGADWRPSDDDEIRGTFHMVDQDFETNNTDLVSPPNRDLEFPSNLHDTPVLEFGGSLQWAHDFPDPIFELPFMNVLVGGDIRHLDGNDQTLLFAAPNAQATLRDGGGKQIFLGFFGQIDVSPIEDFEVLLSGRVDYFKNYDGFQEPHREVRPIFPVTARPASTPNWLSDIRSSIFSRCADQSTRRFALLISTNCSVPSAPPQSPSARTPI